MPRRSTSKYAALAFGTLATLALCAPSFASDSAASELRVQDGRFEPASLVVPAGQPFQLKVVNSGNSAIEFESFDLNRERVVQPGASITVYLPSLNPGTYKFFDDLHEDAGHGTLTAK